MIKQRPQQLDGYLPQLVMSDKKRNFIGFTILDSVWVHPETLLLGTTFSEDRNDLLS